jgi:hypothetical protein
LNNILTFSHDLKEFDKTVVKFAKHKTLTRISNFRRAQIEILPSHKERGILAQLFSDLRKNNLNNKSFDKNLLKEKQFNEQPSLFVRGKNFLVNYSELRNLGEGKKHTHTCPS